MLWPPGGAQGPDEVWAECGAHRPRQLPLGGPGPRGSAAAHQPASTGTRNGVRHLECHRHGGRTHGETLKKSTKS